MTHSLRGMRRADVLKATLAWKNAAGKSKYATSPAIWPVKSSEWPRAGKRQADRRLKFNVENGLGMDGQATKKAALHEAGAALILGGMSHSLHGPVFVVVRARPADVLANVEGHGFDFAGRLPARPGEHELTGIMCQIEAAFAGGEGLTTTAIGERGHFPVPFLGQGHGRQWEVRPCP